MTTLPCSTCKSPILVEGKGAKEVQVHRLAYTKRTGETVMCGYSAFCSRACAQKYPYEVVA